MMLHFFNEIHIHHNNITCTTPMGFAHVFANKYQKYCSKITLTVFTLYLYLLKVSKMSGNNKYFLFSIKLSDAKKCEK